VSEIATVLVYQFGLGALGGFIVGYFIKKIKRLFMIVLGILIIALLYFGVNNIISISFDLSQAASWLVGLISVVPLIGSFIVGLFFGLKFG
jgi:uncharacterized membrane protein (Fun14 family)